MNQLKLIVILSGILLLVASCNKSNDDDGGGTSNCTAVATQAAQGNFKGTAFTSPGGTYIENPGTATGYRCTIYVKSPNNTDCVFPTFDGTQDTILFSINSLENQTITLSDTSGSNTLSFNRIDGTTTDIELAECGEIKITSFNATSEILQGTIIAKGQDGSEINGSFQLSLCIF